MSEVRVNDDLVSFFEAICIDPNSKRMFELAKRAAKTNATILISGETGSGKEILANYIHANSQMCNGPFVSVNCAALPDNMIESILFGYERGAFTSAINSYMGKFEQANHGTLLLDEIAEIPIHLQAKLLRVLQERKVERLGAKHPSAVNVRIIAASNKDLSQQVKLGLFRSDLYFRLNVVPLECKPLRERPGDILPLAELFLKRYATSMNRAIPELSAAVKAKLVGAYWAGNIREMENVIQRVLILSTGEQIEESDITLESVPVSHCMFGSKLAENEANTILQTLNEASGKRGTTARKLNMSPRTLRYKLAKLKEAGIIVPKEGDKHGN